MKSIRQTPGFTLVEALVVVSVLVILVMITATIYQNTQVQARDMEVRDGADKVADAIKLFISKEGHFPAGGSGSSAAAAAGAECASGQNGWFAIGYSCDVEDTLTNLGYLPAGFAAGLPSNTKTGYATVNRQALMVYRYDSGTNLANPYRAMVYFSLEDPSANDAAHFNSELARCGVSTATGDSFRTNYNMQDGFCINQYS